jgi:hypothetical protein
VFSSSRVEEHKKKCREPITQARSQTMNTVGAAASSARAYMHVSLYTYTTHIYYVCISVKSAFVRTTKSTCYITRPIKLHKPSCIYTHFS